MTSKANSGAACLNIEPRDHLKISLVRIISILFSSLFVFCFSPSVNAVNKCVDSAGHVSFSDTPCATVNKAERVEIKSRAGATTLDASSEASLKSSMDKVLAELPPEKREHLKSAILALYIAEGARDQRKSREQIFATVNAQLHGKTAKEVFALADAIKDDKQVQEALRAK